MTEGFQIISSEESSNWENVLQTFANSNQQVFFSFSYHSLLQANGDGVPEAFFYKEGENILLYPYLKNRISKIGEHKIEDEIYDIESVFGYTGPLFNNIDSIFHKKALLKFEQHCQTNKIIAEFIRFNPLLQNQEVYKELEFTKVEFSKDFVVVSLNKSLENILSGYGATLRNELRRAQTYEGIDYYVNNTDSLENFQPLYQSHMRYLKTSSYYQFSEKYFKKLKEFLSENGCIFEARSNNISIASLIFVFHGESVYYLHGCRDINHPLSSNVNKLLMHKAISYFNEHGFSSIVLGGGLTASRDDPLFKFKSKFSEQTVPYFIGKKVIHHKKYEELCDIWEKQYPEFSETNKHIFLKYKMIG